MMSPRNYGAPGVYKLDLPLPSTVQVDTGIPVFLGLASEGPLNAMREIGSWLDFEPLYGPAPRDGYLFYAVRSFFENGGQKCYVLRLKDTSVEALEQGLSMTKVSEDVDLVCAPDVLLDPAQAYLQQRKILTHCDQAGDRFAILDSHPYANDDRRVLEDQRAQLEDNKNAALYYPWIKVAQANRSGEYLFVPACGAVAGVIASTDYSTGVHNAPANRPLEGVADIAVEMSAGQQAQLNYPGVAAVNVLRAFPGRGIRIWGARTLSLDEAWMPLNVRRLFISLRRWIDRNMTDIVYEPNVPSLWARVTTELTDYLYDLFTQGALKGQTQREAFYVKCDEEINPQEVRDAGMLVAEIGIAPAVPAEYIVLRLVQSDGGLSLKEAGRKAVLAPGSEVTVSRPRARGQTGVQITYIHYRGPGTDVAVEYVQMRNFGNKGVNLANWTLRDAAGHVFRFPELTLRPSGSVRIWTKKGINSDTDLYWGSGIAIWNNVGDTAILRDKQGRLVHSYQYTV